MTLFFFGTLRDPALLEIVIGRALRPGEIRPATAPGRRTWQIVGEDYPILRVEAAGSSGASSGASADGILFAPASKAEHEAIAFYEEAEYALSPITVDTATGPVEAHFFDATDLVTMGPAAWSYDDWYGLDGQGLKRLVAIEAASELMPIAATVPVERINDYWPAIMIRARQRARARLERPALGTIRGAFSNEEDVRWDATERPFLGFLALERHVLRHRLFDGGMSAPLSRITVAWGDGVTVLPYDPVLDSVLMIEQFRPGPAARRDPNPWCIEVPAGRLDTDPDPEATLRAEAMEEAGLSLGRLHELPGYYPTPGLASEHLGAWIGEADLSGVTGGVHGKPEEGEDIRTFVLGFDAALAALRSGAVNTGPAQLLLLWLMLERPRLRRDWAGIED